MDRDPCIQQRAVYPERTARDKRAGQLKRPDGQKRVEKIEVNRDIRSEPTSDREPWNMKRAEVSLNDRP